jgi:hypothetical protein
MLYLREGGEERNSLSEEMMWRGLGRKRKVFL